MEDNKKNISTPLTKGIVRKVKFGNGELDDLMNMKPDGDSLIPVQAGVIHAIVPTNVTNITIHKRSNYTNYIGYNTVSKTVVNYTKGTGTVIQTLVTLGEDETINDIKPFINYIIISTTDRLLRYLFANDTYTSVVINVPIKLKIEGYDYETIETESVSLSHDEDVTETGPGSSTTKYLTSIQANYDSILGSLYAKINSQSLDGRLTGAISWRAAYKLIDGTYLMATTPQIKADNLGYIQLVNESYAEVLDFDNPEWKMVTKFKTSKFKATLVPADYDDLENEKDIIQSIVIFFSKPIIKEDIATIYKFDDTEEGILYDINDSSPISSKYLSDYESFSTDWDNIGSPTEGWFQVCEIPFSQIIDTRYTSFNYGDGYMKTDNFYQNYATRESLPVDQLTHHLLSASNLLFNYNSRLWLSGMKRTLATPISYLITDLTYFGFPTHTLDVRLVYKLNCNNETKTVVEEYTDCTFNTSGTNYGISIPLLAYPDSRAYEVSMYVLHSGVWKKYLTDKTLTVSLSHNYSYYIDLTKETYIPSTYELLTTYQVDLATATIVNESIFTEDNLEDGLDSQVQLSELNNPLSFPSAQNYNVGTDSIIGFGVATNTVSEGQYGQYPVYIFTSSGVYAAKIGTGSVIVESVSPISSDVLTGCPINTKYGVFFTTSEGVMVINGSEVKNLSYPMNGRIAPIISNDSQSRFNLNSTHDQVVQLDTLLTEMPQFDTSVYDFELGYDHKNKRLVVSKETIDFSYVLDLTTMSWYRISESYSYFTPLFPDLLGISETRGIVNLSFISHYAHNIQVHFHTRVMNFGTAVRKKIDESLLRCNLKVETSRYAVFEIYASNDNVKWARVAGGGFKTANIDDIQLGYCPASYKYFTFAFWAELKSNYDNHIDAIDVQAEFRYGHRLRPV